MTDTAISPGALARTADERPPRSAGFATGAPPPTIDDHLPGGRRLTARHAILTVALALALLVVCDGHGILRQGDKMNLGVQRSIVLAVGRPAAWISDRLPFASIAHALTGWLSPEQDVSSHNGSFTTSAAVAGAAPRVAPQAFGPQELGLPAAPLPVLHRVLVTGDSMSQPLDAQLARALAGDGVTTIRDAKLGTGISKPDLLDWGRYSALQSARDGADAVVVFLGAGEGFPMKTPFGTVTCCDARWAAEYATRVRTMMSTYSRGGATRVYWLLLPIAREQARNQIIRVVNQAIRVAAGGFGDQVRTIDIPGTFTPGGRYRDAMPIGGRPQIVRDPDGLHLDEEGAKVAASMLTRALGGDFRLGRR